MGQANGVKTPWATGQASSVEQFPTPRHPEKRRNPRPAPRHHPTQNNIQPGNFAARKGPPGAKQPINKMETASTTEPRARILTTSWWEKKNENNEQPKIRLNKRENSKHELPIPTPTARQRKSRGRGYGALTEKRAKKKGNNTLGKPAYCLFFSKSEQKGRTPPSALAGKLLRK